MQVYISLVTLIAAMIPFFGNFAALVGAIGFTPLVRHVPGLTLSIMAARLSRRGDEEGCKERGVKRKGATRTGLKRSSKHTPGSDIIQSKHLSILHCPLHSYTSSCSLKHTKVMTYISSLERIETR